jgi:hypothetical protein
VESGRIALSWLRLSRLAASMASWSLANWIGFLAMLTSCSAWKRLASTLFAPTCRTPTWLTVGIMAMVAEEERRMISKRTKDALAAAKKRGTQLGGFRGVIPSKKTRALGIKAIQARADAKAGSLGNYRRPGKRV